MVCQRHEQYPLSKGVCTYKQPTDILFKGLLLSGKARPKESRQRSRKRKSLLSSACLCCVWQYLLAYTQSTEILFRRMSKAKSQRRNLLEFYHKKQKGEIRMQRFITDERTGIQYELIGDYYYPCLTIENEEPPTLTKNTEE